MDAGIAGATGVPPRNLDLIEYAMGLLLPTLPPDWISVHAVFAPRVVPPVASLHVLTTHGWQPLAATTWVLGAVAEHQRRALAAGTPWDQMSVDRHRDGRLEVLTETPGSRIPSRGPERGRPPKVIRTIPRWLRRTVPAITIGCFAAAAVLLITARPWVPPPRADIVAVPAPAPRQQEAFDLLARWYAARNNADPALNHL